MGKRGKKFLALFLAFCILGLGSQLTAQEEKGANLKIQKNDGEKVTGELITVKRDSLLLLDDETQYDVTIDIKDVKSITVLKKSWLIELGVIGFLAGAAVAGLTSKKKKTWSVEGEPLGERIAIPLAPGFILAGSGVVIGAVMGIDKTIRIAGKSDAEIQEALQKLSKKARVPNYQ